MKGKGKKCDKGTTTVAKMKYRLRVLPLLFPKAIEHRDHNKRYNCLPLSVFTFRNPKVEEHNGGDEDDNFDLLRVSQRFEAKWITDTRFNGIDGRF